MNAKPSNVSEAAKAACRWVTRYRASTFATPVQLYQETGYAEFHHELLEETFEAVLRAEPALVGEWEMFSGDKRWSPAWYFQLDGSRPFVGHFPQHPKKRERHFDDPVKACAYFVKMEMENFRAP